jgi:HEPN domain-containing protein
MKKRMREGNKKIILERWFRKGDEDELNAASILKHRDGTPSVVCFLSQQLAEKYLKSMLIFYDQEVMKIHDLARLGSVVAEFDRDIENLMDDLELLNEYYIETRYVGNFPDFSWEDAMEAFDAAGRIKKFILEKINKL